MDLFCYNYKEVEIAISYQVSLKRYETILMKFKHEHSSRATLCELK